MRYWAGDGQHAFDCIVEGVCLWGVDGVVAHFFSFTCALNEACFSQEFQMVSHGRRAHLQHGSDACGAKLSVSEHPENAHAVYVAKVLERIGKSRKLVNVVHEPFHNLKFDVVSV